MFPIDLGTVRAGVGTAKSAKAPARPSKADTVAIVVRVVVVGRAAMERTR